MKRRNSIVSPEKGLTQADFAIAAPLWEISFLFDDWTLQTPDSYLDGWPSSLYGKGDDGPKIYPLQSRKNR